MQGRPKRADGASLLKQRLEHLEEREPEPFDAYAKRWLADQRRSFAPARSDPARIGIGGQRSSDTCSRSSAICRADVRSFRTAMVGEGRLSPKTINNYVTTLGLMLRQAVEDELIPANPAAGLRRLRAEHREMEWYELAEAEAADRAYARGVEGPDRPRRLRRPPAGGDPRAPLVGSRLA